MPKKKDRGGVFKVLIITLKHIFSKLFASATNDVKFRFCTWFTMSRIMKKRIKNYLKMGNFKF